MPNLTHIFFPSVVALVLQLPGSGMASQSSDATTDWQEWSPQIFQQAQDDNHLVLLDVTAEWCVFCKKMDETTYRDSDVIRIINEHFIPVRVADETHPDLARKYAKYGRPVTVIMTADGTEIIAKPGYLKPQWMVWFLQAIAMEQNQAALRK